MSRSVIIYTVAVCVLVGACNSNKPKPVSDSISKTTVLVNGEKDSVINNPRKSYGNATIAEPCVKCIIEVIQADEGYKKSAATAQDLNYVINYVKTTQPQDTISEIKATNALRVDVLEKDGTPHKLSSYIYDNSLSKLYFINGSIKTEVKTDAASLQRIRNSCYWGVASGK